MLCQLVGCELKQSTGVKGREIELFLGTHGVHQVRLSLKDSVKRTE